MFLFCLELALSPFVITGWEMVMSVLQPAKATPCVQHKTKQSLKLYICTHAWSIYRKSFTYPPDAHHECCGQLHLCCHITYSVKKKGSSMWEKIACLRAASGALQREESDEYWRGEGTKAAMEQEWRRCWRLGELVRERGGAWNLSDKLRNWHCPGLWCH